MKETKLHMPLSISLVVLFTVFNVGLPVMVATCPMMNGSLRCSACINDEPGNGTSLSFETRGCCSFTMLAERNTNEFRQVPPFSGHQSPAALCATLSPRLLYGDSFSHPITYTHAPPLVGDIPIVTSALLI